MVRDEQDRPCQPGPWQSISKGCARIPIYFWTLRDCNPLRFRNLQVMGSRRSEIALRLCFRWLFFAPSSSHHTLWADGNLFQKIVQGLQSISESSSFEVVARCSEIAVRFCCLRFRHPYILGHLFLLCKDCNPFQAGYLFHLFMRVRARF